MLIHRDLCGYSDTMLSYGRCSPLSIDPEGGWLRKRCLGFRCFHEAPEPHPSYQRVGRKCIKVWGGMELLSEYVFLPYLKLTVLFPEQGFCNPMEVLRRVGDG